MHDFINAVKSFFRAKLRSAPIAEETFEVNLALALENYGADVDFETVWGQGHVEAEQAGSSTENFINWVNECIG